MSSQETSMDRNALTRYQGQVPVPLAVYAAAAALGLKLDPVGLEPLGYRKDGTPIYPIAGGDGAAPVEITPEQLAANPAVQALLQASAEAAVRAVNTVDPGDRPAAGGGAIRDYSQAPAYLRRRYPMPRLGNAMRAGARDGVRASEIFEWDFAQAAREVFGYDKTATADDKEDPIVLEHGAKGIRNYRSIVWPKSREEFADVLFEMGE
jgi:hypothetical protein